MNRWGDIACRYPTETLVLKYEDFRQDPLSSLKRLARHFGLDLTEMDLISAIAVSSKEIMAAHQDPSDRERPIRADGAGDTLYSTADLAQLGAILARHLRHDFGYGYFERPRGFRGPSDGAAP